MTDTPVPPRRLTLEDYRRDMEGCSRCSSCKWIPLDHITGQRYSQVCPSSWYHEFHAYSGSGKLNTALSILDGRSEFDESAAAIFYACRDVRRLRRRLQGVPQRHRLRRHLRRGTGTPSNSASPRSRRR